MEVQEWLTGVASLGSKEYYAREGLAFKILITVDGVPGHKMCVCATEHNFLLLWTRV
jgi:hypothetical protein